MAVFVGGVDIRAFFYEQTDDVGVTFPHSSHQYGFTVCVGSVDIRAFFHKQADGVSVTFLRCTHEGGQF